VDNATQPFSPQAVAQGLQKGLGTISRLFRGRSIKEGLPPGTPVHVGLQKTDRVTVTVIDYDQETIEARTIDDPAECAAYRHTPSVTWINVDGLHQVEVIEGICRCFSLHPLTVEDILNTTQRPKVDLFDHYLYLVVKVHTFDPASHVFEAEQVSMVLGEGFLITFQEKPGDCFDSVRHRLQANKGRIRKLGPDYLLYALLDAITDNTFTVLENVGEEIESLEEELLTAPVKATLHRLHALKRELLVLRRATWPLREVINALLRDEIEFISDSIGLYLKDLYDHTIQVIDTLETLRDIVSGMTDIYLSSVSNRTNEIMKVLTIFAAIFIPLTFIAGVYGMNFNPEASPWNMPELNWRFGYPFALGLMLLTAMAMFWLFRKKKWL